mmetsp:Transcript_17564/g.32914  ORF Transcript_17564/g.32914 Transcript_17564/m.32914 type:complete len:129 (+) Transcript_17564:885-1271(+)
MVESVLVWGKGGDHRVDCFIKRANVWIIYFSSLKAENLAHMLNFQSLFHMLCASNILHKYIPMNHILLSADTEIKRERERVKKREKKREVETVKTHNNYPTRKERIKDTNCREIKTSTKQNKTHLQQL